MDWAKLRKDVTEHEGIRLMPYRDTVGKLTIGIGRNLDDVGITDSEANFLLTNDLTRSKTALILNIPWWGHLDDVRQRVLIDMCFNMGIKSLLGFKTTLRLIEAGDYKAGGKQMLKSKWAGQVGRRARRLSYMMQTGQDIDMKDVPTLETLMKL